MNKPLFDLGRTLATPGALAALEKADVSPATLLSRHATGDWGDLTEADKRLNDEALEDGSRIFSGYILPTGSKGKVWVITEGEDDQGQRAATTLLLPSEY